MRIWQGSRCRRGQPPARLAQWYCRYYRGRRMADDARDASDKLRQLARTRREGVMRVGDYPVFGKPYWLTMTGVAALGMVGVVLMLAVH
jgi:hypothetical protein